MIGAVIVAVIVIVANRICAHVLYEDIDLPFECSLIRECVDGSS